jgi:hypothetical protein
MSEMLDRFVHFLNIDTFTAQLRDPLLTPDQRRIITTLLQEAIKRGEAAGWRRPLG